MNTENQIREKQIFEALDKACPEDSMPLPHCLLDCSCSCEVTGFMGWMISKAFQSMRETEGQSNWECDAKCALGMKVSEKRKTTMNTLRKYLLECQSLGYIESCREVDDRMVVKVNVKKLFEGVGEWVRK